MGTPNTLALTSNCELSEDADCRSVALRRVLVASDKPVAQRLLSVLLAKRGHNVDVADSVEQALSNLAVNRFDFVLIDFDRLESIRVVNTFKEHCTDTMSGTCFVCLVTGSAAAGERSGFDMMIAKPIDVALLYEVIERSESYTSWMAAAAEVTPVLHSATPQQSHERRASKRFQVAHGSTELTLSDGTKQPCRVIDLSLGGAAVETYPKPGTGTRVKIGRTNGRVIRHTENGVAVEFVLQGLPV
jgi:CheY-like chemotaxis protein